VASVLLASSMYCADYLEIRDTLTGATRGNLIGSTNVPASTWYHLAYVYSGKSGSIYVNGRSPSSSSYFPHSSAVNATRAKNYFGLNPSGEHAYVQLDEIRLYNKALTETQIKLDMKGAGVAAVGIC
jgi:hypothetical protein